MSTFVLVHGAWHTGDLFEPVAQLIRDAGHTVYCPTIAGNRPEDSRTMGLEDAISSIVDFLHESDLQDVVLMGHSYGGMIISGVADRCPERLRRLIYWNAFVPNNGESVNDLVPPHYVNMFDAINSVAPDQGVMLPFAVWREAFINDGSEELARKSYDQLNAHPYATFTDKIELKKNLAEMEIGKSYINGTEDTAMPHSLPWHPRLSEKLGLFRLVQIAGSHEVCFTNPGALSEAIILAGRD
ncbi:alpha/beta hydrolase [uncultured Sulfitobacter sp.]|uniref:alpha/beta hydrolase n=1 Tax=uncultured Sulfitobacter sp. TaxID=191468 RepID=UPI0030FCE5A2